MEKQGNLLLIASQEADQTTLARWLAAAGYAVSAARDGRQGLEMVKAQKPEVVLFDLHAPDLGGVLFMESFMQDEAIQNIPVVLLASPGDMELVGQCLALGADDYLVRPYSQTLLKAQVRELQAVNRRRQEERELNFLPSELPQLPGWEIAAFFQPARQVAGDFYDVFTMSQGRRLGVVVADVCDKGVGAALFMALIRSLTRAFAEQNYSLNLMDSLGGGRRRDAPMTGTTALKNAVLLTNNYIANNHWQLGYFATMFFGMIDPDTGGLTYINGGHCPPVILGPDGKIKTTLPGTGPAVGIIVDAPFGMKQATLEPGDLLFVYSDGVTDANDPQGKLFEEEQLLTLIQETPAPTAASLLERVRTRVFNHIGDADQFDDITMMGVRYEPKPA
jgi:sigma-B regulation protein RsbU (phosphoserine phosphatase)